MTLLITDRLYLRRFKPEDWRDLHAYLSDPMVVKYEPYGIFTEEESRKEAMERAKNEEFLAVCLRDTDKLIGNLYFSKREFESWELGYVFHSGSHGCGYATESIRALLEYAFHKLKVRRIIAHCDPCNEASWRLLERLHMRREGHFLKNVYFHLDTNNNPIWKDTYRYAILKEEW